MNAVRRCAGAPRPARGPPSLAAQLSLSLNTQKTQLAHMTASCLPLLQVRVLGEGYTPEDEEDSAVADITNVWVYQVRGLGGGLC